MSPRKNSVPKVAEKEIRQDQYVRLMSGLNWALNLSRGKGKEPLRFDGFGDIKRVQYGQLVEMLTYSVNERFLTAGHFFILDEEVVHQLGLEDALKNVLSKEQIEKFIDNSCPTESSFELYKSANEKQKYTICDMMIQAIRENKDLNLNLVRMIEKESRIKIIEKAEEAKEVMKDGIP
jgi:hypothetical protein